VRGYDPDTAILGKSGWFVRQELTSAPIFGDSVQSFGFVDLGQASTSNELLGGLGVGLRAGWHGFNLMGFAADALSRTPAGRTRCCHMGINLSYGFTAF
jgi:hemolysin activation/secretion protein